MIYQEVLPKFWPLSHVASLLTINYRHWRKSAALFEKLTQQSTSVSTVTNAFVCGVPILYGCL